MRDTMPSGVSPGRTTRVDSPRPHVAADTNKDPDSFLPSSRCAQSPTPIFSSISASCVARSGTRSSASAMTISARPSRVDNPYSLRKSSRPPTPPERERMPSIRDRATASTRVSSAIASRTADSSRGTTASSASA